MARKKQTKKQKENEPIQYKSGIGIDENLAVKKSNKRRSKEELKEVQIYKCTILDCNKAYVQSSGLKKHGQSKHK